MRPSSIGNALPKSKRVDEWPNVDFFNVFPAAFTFWCLLVFAGPVMKSMTLAYEPSVSFWMGRMPRYIVLMPAVLIFLGHCVHRVRGAPSRLAVIISLIGSSSVLIFLGNKVFMNAYHFANAFAASDCEPGTDKYMLEASWQRARDFSETCYSGTRGTQGHVITDCSSYEEAARDNPSWAYLRKIELDYGCGGWCAPGPGLWVKGAVLDPCSAVVSEVLTAKVERLSTQVIAFCLIVAALTAVFIIILGPDIPNRRVSFVFEPRGGVFDAADINFG
mmetsp:Transcript_97428/g.275562  ORF Transcript_97428/g.275562 Transcript_97428/m.275562 type:complete len:276 (+) Transcript_97428:163-990(+)